MKRFLILFSLIAFISVSCAGPSKVGWTKRNFRQDQFAKDLEECMETAVKEEAYSRTSGVFDYCMFKKGYEHPPQSKSPYFAKQLRADLGRIGIVSASFQPVVRFHTPMTKGKASLHGAGEGVVSLLKTAKDTGQMAVGSLPLIPVVAAVGSIVGAITGVPSQKIKETEDTLNDYLATVNFQETMRERLLKAARKLTRYPFLLLEAQGPTFLDEEVTYGSLSKKGIDTILEIGLRNCELSRVENSINPDLYFVMVAGIRLIRATDGHVLLSCNFAYQLTPHKFSEWGVNNAQPFREELDRGFQYLALDIVKALTHIQTSLNR